MVLDHQALPATLSMKSYLINLIWNLYPSPNFFEFCICLDAPIPEAQFTIYQYAQRISHKLVLEEEKILRRTVVHSLTQRSHRKI